MAYRIPTFIERARNVKSHAEAKALCEEELAWIYATYNGTTPHKVVNAYRKALREADLWVPFLRRPVTLMEDGEVLNEEGFLPGYMRERQDHVQARFAKDHARVNDLNAFSEDAEMLLGHEDAYLQYAMRALQASDWATMAVGLCMATGRRSIEICLKASMEPHTTPYEIVYTGQAKTATMEEEERERTIPVLVPSMMVCDTLPRMRAALVQWLAAKGKTLHEETFDNDVGANLRYAVPTQLATLFPNAKTLSPRTLRNCFVALALEAETPDGVPLCPLSEQPLHFITRILGHKDEVYKPAEHYVKNVMPRLRRGIVLP